MSSTPTENKVNRTVPNVVLHVQVAGDVPVDQLEQIGKLFHSAFRESGTVTTYDNVSAQLLRSTNDIDGVVVHPAMLAEHIAYVAHSTVRAFCFSAETDDLPEHWEDMSVENRNEVLQGVLFALRYNASARDLHETWLQQKLAEGWAFGETLDTDSKIHPLLVAYDDLPKNEQIKYHLFAATVRALRWKLASPTTENVVKVEIDGNEVSLLVLREGDKFKLNGSIYVATGAPYVNYAKPIPVWSIDVRKIEDVLPIQETSVPAEPVEPYPFPKAEDFETKEDHESTGTPEQDS